MSKSMRNRVHFLLQISIVQMAVACSLLIPQGWGKNGPKKYALLIGGGCAAYDTFASFYTNVEYVHKALKQMGYHDGDIRVLFHGGKTHSHPLVEAVATKENFIEELNRLAETMDSNDSLLIFRSGHGNLDVQSKKYDTSSDHEDSFGEERMHRAGTLAVMNFPDGDLTCFEFEKSLKKIAAKQMVVILNQCFCGQFTDITLNIHNVVVVCETKENELAIHDQRKTVRWKHNEWPFVKCFFDGFLQCDGTKKKRSVFNAFQHLLHCNPNIEGIAIKADRPLLKENPVIRYGRGLKKGSVYIE
jgi:hypothetical protein